MKPIITVIILFISVAVAKAQDEDLPPVPDNQYIESTQAPSEKEDKIDFQLETGFSVGTFGKGYSFTSSYILPKASIKLTPRFNLSMGALLSNNQWVGNAKANENTPVSDIYGYPSLSSGIFFAEGEYNLLPGLSLNGQFLGNTSGNQDYYNAYSNISSMMSVGLNYNITPNLSVGASFHMVEYNYNPFYSSSPGSSFLNPW